MGGLRVGILGLALVCLAGCAEAGPAIELPSSDGDGGSDTDANADENASERDASAPVACTGSTREALCATQCESFCQHQRLFCLESECRPDDCEAGGEIFEVCMERCDDVECARDLCEEQELATCETFGIEIKGLGVFESFCWNRDPSCVLAPSFGCSDVCGSNEGVGGDLVDNGVCEDGREASEASTCERGTDCTDCGRHVCVQAGEECANHGDCCAFTAELGALCVDPDQPDTGMPPGCLPVCDEEHPCPEGFSCTRTSNGDSVCIDNR